METFHLLILGFSITVLLAAILIFLRQFSICGSLLASCCEQLCIPENKHQVSHLDTHTLKVHYKNSGTGVIIEGLTASDHYNISLDIEGNINVETEVSRDVTLSPLPLNISIEIFQNKIEINYYQADIPAIKLMTNIVLTQLNPVC